MSLVSESYETWGRDFRKDASTQEKKVQDNRVAYE